MAKFYPELHEMDRLSEPITEGERAMLEALAEVLDDSYEVFFQSWIYGQHMDIIILRRNFGVHIIEVKDYQLGLYYVGADGDWYVHASDGDHPLHESPTQQLTRYKNQFVNLFSPALVYLSIFNAEKSTYGCVTTSLYLHKTPQHVVDNFIATNMLDSTTKHMPFWGREVTCSPDILRQKLRRLYTFGSRPSECFYDAVYTELRRLCQLTAPTLDQLVRHNLVLDKVQQRHYDNFRQKLAAGRGLKMKIRGASGAGKTRLLAEFAALALARFPAGKVLIITFNITLIHKIHDMISLSPHRPRMRDVQIFNYHVFYYTYAHTHRLEPNPLNMFIDKPRDKYMTILVDETQDFCSEWIDTLHNFLDTNGNIVFFCDEHQDIYAQAKIEQKVVYTGIGGAWRQLNSNHRIHNHLATIANRFQEKFLTRYEFAPIEPLEADLFDTSECTYYYIDEAPIAELVPTIYRIYRHLVSEKDIHDNDVAILGSSIENLQTVECFLRRRQNIGTNITFVTYEEEASFKQWRQRINSEFVPKTDAHTKAISKLDGAYYKLQRSRKCSFWANHGTLKVSTIHSFKGWETRAVILLITRADGDSMFGIPAASADKKSPSDMPPDSKSDTPRNMAELIYTGMTRAQENLIILNIGSQPLDDYLRQMDGINLGNIEDFTAKA